ncbi:cyclic nucleotide-binding protein [Desulfosarcina alkanivorans]|jgi:CRP-like cAMP-binding protein|uniref:Cyclic nucleotide-binding protein n=1 Tax=Desulfosarcina alkanivorans TaxID=571177 RepID=A0A5K7YGF3_9BACT|nr:Crp/Fnr family transcriptional regulator [Desulfosarcina alkanivorans]BBO68156.1 cyclic nucleotide-binding protein [Desulfosarcina alkanivorans]
MKTDPESLGRKIALFRNANLFKELSPKAHLDLAEMAARQHYEKNDIIFQAQEPCDVFTIVEKGLVRVCRYSATGKRLTYLLAGPGEPLNLIGPFTGASRDYVAESCTDTVIMSIERKAFAKFSLGHPQLIIAIIEILGQAVDSSNSRILDMQDKKVIQRLKRVLHTLSEKFGPVLNFTAMEIADLASTTTESALRVLSDLRQEGIIEKSRGQIDILKPEALIDPESEDLWI